MAESFQLPSCIRGYHVYKDLWNPLLRDQLHCQRERSNDKDRYAIAVVDDGVVVGHLPRKISLVCSLFIKRGGTIMCEVTDRRRYSADLLQGGLEVPCMVTFTGSSESTKKLKKLTT